MCFDAWEKVVSQMIRANGGKFLGVWVGVAQNCRRDLLWDAIERVMKCVVQTAATKIVCHPSCELSSVLHKFLPKGGISVVWTQGVPWLYRTLASTSAEQLLLETIANHRIWD